MSQYAQGELVHQAASTYAYWLGAACYLLCDTDDDIPHPSPPDEAGYRSWSDTDLRPWIRQRLIVVEDAQAKTRARAALAMASTARKTMLAMELEDEMDRHLRSDGGWHFDRGLIEAR